MKLIAEGKYFTVTLEPCNDGVNLLLRSNEPDPLKRQKQVLGMLHIPYHPLGQLLEVAPCASTITLCLLAGA